MNWKHLIWIIPLFLVIGFILGYWNGYGDEDLNLENAISFCESLNDPFIYSEITWGSWKWCSFNSEDIVCSSGDSCFNEEGSIKLIFDNPTLNLKQIDYFDGEEYPYPFSFEAQE